MLHLFKLTYSIVLRLNSNNKSERQSNRKTEQLHQDGTISSFLLALKLSILVKMNGKIEFSIDIKLKQNYLGRCVICFYPN